VNVLNKKMKLLAAKLTSLQGELAVSREIFQSASAEVDRMFNRKYFPEIPQNTHQEESEEKSISQTTDDKQSKKSKKQEKTKSEKKTETELHNKEEKKIDPEVKKLFRKISLEIHPDKLIGLPDGYEKEKKESLYLRAIKLKDENDIVGLSDVAIELGIEPPEITVESLKKVENKIKTIKKEINQIESTVVWHWFFTEDKKKKDNMLQQLFKIMYEKTSNNFRS
tara:strand:- start:866 stop:1537 length:672 start_codon:yes stop_codon:yes gene_type:complete